jgi:trigger factor
MTIQHFTFSTKESHGLKRGYSIVVAAAYITEKLHEELKRVGEKVKIPGFRPGKVPMQVLKQKYKQNAMGEVISNAVEDAVRALLDAKAETPALRPDVKIESYEDDADMTLSVAFDLMPTAPEIDYAKVSIQKPKFSVAEEEVSKSIQRLADGKREVKDRDAKAKAKEGDVVVIDFKGFLGKEAFSGGEGKGYSLELGSGQFIPGFEEQLIGVKAEDKKDVVVSFPAEYHSADLAGKEARFEVTVHKVQEVIPAAIDDALAASYGYESLANLQSFIREQLEKEHGHMSRGYVKKQLFDALEQQCSFEVPESMLKLEFDSIWKQALAEAKQEGKTEADVERERDQYDAIAKRRVQLGILLSQTAGRNKLEVTQKDIQQAIFEQARMYPGQEMKVVEFFQKNPQQARELQGPILEEKAVDFILERITVSESSKTLDELLEAEHAEEAKKAASKTTKPKKAEEEGASEKKKAAPAAKKADVDAAKADAPKKKPAAKKKGDE